MSSIKLAVDIGGTFTDAILKIEDALISKKIPTTPVAPQQAFIEVVESLLNSAGISPTDVDSIVHGTTIATNALIERMGATTALIKTKGFRDSLEIGYESRYDQYDLGLEKLPPLVPRYLRLVVDERTLCNGEVMRPLDESRVAALAEQLIEHKVESVAIGFLHAHRNPSNEQRAHELLSSCNPPGN